MRWLVVRAFSLTLLLVALCTAALIIGRLDHTPTPLQVVGFDTCNGEPCFRGIKPGMEWTSLQQMFPEETSNDWANFDLPTNQIGVVTLLAIVPASNQATVQTLKVEAGFGPPLAFTAADIIIVYGLPCQVYRIYLTDRNEAEIVLFYPTMFVTVQADRLHWDSRVRSLFISNDQAYSSCKVKRNMYYGSWYGFASDETYRRRNLAAIGQTGP